MAKLFHDICVEKTGVSEGKPWVHSAICQSAFGHFQSQEQQLQKKNNACNNSQRQSRSSAMERYTRMRSSNATWIACSMSSRWWTTTGMCIWIPFSIQYLTLYATKWSACPSTVLIRKAIICVKRPGGSTSAGRRLIPRCVYGISCVSPQRMLITFYSPHILALLFAVSCAYPNPLYHYIFSFTGAGPYLSGILLITP